MFDGSGGSSVGAGNTFRGRSRSGSSDLRYVVYTFGSSDICEYGRSRLRKVSNLVKSGFHPNVVITYSSI
jgi:hypothetical protein